MTTTSFRKLDDYYTNARTDVAAMIPSDAARILEVGCGSGNTLGYLKQNGIGTWHGGVEINAGMAKEAAAKVDRIWIGAIEDVLAAEGGVGAVENFDAILCLDVLEHLLDPWTVLKKLVGNLSPGGTVIASIPNIRFYKAVFPLLLKGKWSYEERGVLDSTHLRFFTRETAVAMVRDAGLEITAVEPSTALKPWKNKWIINRLTGGRLIDFYAYNYRIAGRKPAIA
ncbi:class I SAM-dependent methyltransferase [Shumkonia mesophila]|uniref:class I SAM-dependent methyltransferase n=1 Tax=Shumkonia mesophila TaxID=2838854 RepID=UPI00293427FE|nr:class I SAM-dependent methyltransferase [Shumkonia mesophila]